MYLNTKRPKSKCTSKSSRPHSISTIQTSNFHSHNQPLLKLKTLHSTTSTNTRRTNSVHHTSFRSVSFVKAKFDIVQVKVQSKIPDILSLPPPNITPTTNTADNNDSHSQSNQHQQFTSTPNQCFLNPSILSNSQSLLDFATLQPRGSVYLVRKKDLGQFYETTYKMQQESQNQQSNPLLLSNSSLNNSNQQFNNNEQPNTNQSTPNTNSNTNLISNINTKSTSSSSKNSQLELFYQEQQIALQSAPTVKIEDLATKENEKRRQFYNSTNAKPLQLFKLPKKHEIQAIIAASKGDLITVQQIIGKNYHDCLQSMSLLPQRFIQKTPLNPQDWSEIHETDIDIQYNPTKYQFFPNTTILHEFFSWLDQSFSPETLQSFRSSSLYNYEMSNQLQKGGSIMHHSVQRGDMAILQFILKHGAVSLINQQTSNNSTPLHWAAGAGWLPIVKLLVEKYNANYYAITNSWSIDVFGRDSGQLPLHWASASGHTAIVDYLYQLSPVTIGIKDEKDNSVVCVAKKGLHFDTIRKVQSAIQDEYVPIKLEIHTIEQNIFFDPQQLLNTNNNMQNNNGNNNNMQNNNQYNSFNSYNTQSNNNNINNQFQDVIDIEHHQQSYEQQHQHQQHQQF